MSPQEPLLAAVGKRLRVDSDAAAGAIGHLGERGKAREHRLLEALEQLLPRKYALTTGFVIGGGETISSQQDILIYDADDYPALDTGAGHNLVPESVYCAMSVRSVLRPADLEEHAASAQKFKKLVADAVSGPCPALYVVFAYRLEGDKNRIGDGFTKHIRARSRGERIDLIYVLDGDMWVDSHSLGFGNERTKIAGGIAGATFDFDPESDASLIRQNRDSFVGFFQVLLTGLTGIRLRDLRTWTVAQIARPSSSLFVADAQTVESETTLTQQPGFHCRYYGESAFLSMRRGSTGQLVVVYANTGTEAWVKANPKARAVLRVTPKGDRTHHEQGWARNWTSPDVYATQASDVVLPGQLGIFAYDIQVPQAAPSGEQRFTGLPGIDEGPDMEDEGYFQAINVIDSAPA